MTEDEKKQINKTFALFSNKEKEIVQKTARGGNAPETRATPKLLLEYYQNEGKQYIGEHKILDFGCGHHMYHVNMLREIGCNVEGFDFSIEGSEKVLDRKYDRILAANVLNVQPTSASLHLTLKMMELLLKPDGEIYANYPSFPRKLGLSIPRMLFVIHLYFDSRLIYKRNHTYILTHHGAI